MKKFCSVGNLKGINLIALVRRKQTYSFSRDSKSVELGIEQKAPDTAVSIDERMNPLKTKIPEGYCQISQTRHEIALNQFAKLHTQQFQLAKNWLSSGAWIPSDDDLRINRPPKSPRPRVHSFKKKLMKVLNIKIGWVFERVLRHGLLDDKGVPSQNLMVIVTRDDICFQSQLLDPDPIMIAATLIHP